ncbi:hypothetical protein LBMAG56_23300 [Verrucomicrobiota bacterium]|nr:hypothetical protein LBMAG56_23300 [Verrucomicrobiota bacterium]
MIQPFLQKHCLKCHGPEKQKGKLRLDGPWPDLRAEADVLQWEKVRKQIAGGAMPPEEEPAPSADELAAVLDAIGGELGRAALLTRGGAGRRTLRRLTRNEYSHSLQDLLGLRFAEFEVKLGDRLPPDGLGRSFQNDADTLAIQPLHLWRFVQPAEVALDATIVTGPKPPVYRYALDLAGLRAVGDAPQKKTAPVIFHDGEARDPGSKTTLTARAVGVTKLTGQGIQLAPNYQRMVPTLAGRQGYPHLLLTLPIAVPEAGVLRVRVRASGSIPPGEGAPRLQLGMYFHGTNHVDIPFAALAVTNPAGAPADYVFEVPIHFVDAPWDLVRGHRQLHLKLDNAYVPLRDRVREPGVKSSVFPWPEPQLLLHAVEIETPWFPSWPPPAHRALLAVPDGVTGETEPARVVLQRFMDRAFRRPCTAEEVGQMVSLFERTRRDAADFATAIKTPLAAVLCSPHFLTLVEKKGATKEPLSPHELAARLAYFLWDTTPDDELLQLAGAGTLNENAVLAAQLERLLKSPRTEKFCRSFVSQWLGLGVVEHIQVPFCDVKNTMDSRWVAEQRDRAIKRSLADEPVRFFQHLLAQDLPLRTLIDSDFLVVNDRLAAFYGAPAAADSTFRAWSEAPANRRGGLLTMAGVIAAASEGNASAVVKRGNYVLSHLLDLDVGTPPANVMPLAQQAKANPGFAKLSVREQLQQHLSVATCAVCHNRIDPLGYFWDGYDLSGRPDFFGRPPGQPVNLSGRFPDRTTFSDFTDFRAKLADRRFTPGFLRKLLAYALGRRLDYSDDAVVKQLAEKTDSENLGLRGVIREVVFSEAFHTK